MSWAGEMYMDEVASNFYERGFVGRDSDFNGVGLTVYRCGTCYALVAHEDRRGHYEQHQAEPEVTTEDLGEAHDQLTAAEATIERARKLVQRWERGTSVGILRSVAVVDLCRALDGDADEED